jgi:hypothetical protein
MDANRFPVSAFQLSRCRRMTTLRGRAPARCGQAQAPCCVKQVTCGRTQVVCRGAPNRCEGAHVWCGDAHAWCKRYHVVCGRAHGLCGPAQRRCAVAPALHVGEPGWKGGCNILIMRDLESGVGNLKYEGRDSEAFANGRKSEAGQGFLIRLPSIFPISAQSETKCKCRSVLLNLNRTPKWPAESCGDASSPQGDSDAPVTFIPAVA